MRASAARRASVPPIKPRPLTATAPNASLFHQPLAIGATSRNNQNLLGPTFQSPAQRPPAHAIQINQQFECGDCKGIVNFIVKTAEHKKNDTIVI
jgi:hypothetical protein